MRFKLAFLFLVASAMDAGAQDCNQIYQEQLREAARCGHTCNIARLQQLDNMHQACRNNVTRQQPRLDNPTREALRDLTITPPPQTERDRQISNAFDRFDRLTGRIPNRIGNQGLCAIDPSNFLCQAATNRQQNNAPSPPAGYRDPFLQPSAAVRSAPHPDANKAGFNPFTQRVEQDAVNLEPPRGYQDPFRLPPPGKLERHQNCTFNSPSCR
jgi:hypothetical protein